MSLVQLNQHTSQEKISSLPIVSARLKEPKVVVIREEFIALTGDPLIAAVLNQLVYWSQRVTNFDLFLQEEKSSPPKCSSALQYGWFYKSASELIEETMLCVTPATLRRYLDFIEERGWIKTRTNPQQKWDRTIQYRVNLRKLSIDLQNKGYALPGFLKDAFLPSFQNPSLEEQKVKRSKFSRKEENETSNFNNASFEGNKISPSNEKKQKVESSKNDSSNGEKITSRMGKNDSSNTEITHKNTNREHTQRTRAREENFSDLENLKKSKLANSSTKNVIMNKSESDESVSEEMVRLWEYHVVQKLSPQNWRGVLHLTEERKGQLESLFAFHFQNDIRLWERFCLRVKGTSFLMGEGPRKWHVTLDWVLCDGNLLKILEGNYDDLSSDELYDEGPKPNPVKDTEKAAIIASIKDPVWQNWCHKLAEGVRLNELRMAHEPLSLVELNQIANAHFLECEDEKLVWIGSFDQCVLNKIEDLRLKISWVFKQDYPNARAVRTRLDKSPPSLAGEISHA